MLDRVVPGEVGKRQDGERRSRPEHPRRRAGDSGSRGSGPDPEELPSRGPARQIRAHVPKRMREIVGGGKPQLRLLGKATRHDVPQRGRRMGVDGLDGRGLFGDARGGIFREITEEFKDFDGGTIERDATVYKEAHDMVVTVDEFKTVQSDVYTRREDLKRAIGRTSEAMQAAETEAEQKKLEAVLNAQYGQLSAVGRRV